MSSGFLDTESRRFLDGMSSGFFGRLRRWNSRMAIPLHKRRKIADFDPVRDGKTVTQFCKELGISRQTYHNIKHRIAQKGRAGIVPDSTAPKNPIKKFDEADKIAVIHARQHLMEQGLDYGPWSIYYFLFDSVGADRAPSRSTIALWLQELSLIHI